jgi:hypothetical protein
MYGVVRLFFQWFIGFRISNSNTNSFDLFAVAVCCEILKKSFFVYVNTPEIRLQNHVQFGWWFIADNDSARWWAFGNLQERWPLHSKLSLFNNPQRIVTKPVWLIARPMTIVRAIIHLIAVEVSRVDGAGFNYVKCEVTRRGKNEAVNNVSLLGANPICENRETTQTHADYPYFMDCKLHLSQLSATGKRVPNEIAHNERQRLPAALGCHRRECAEKWISNSIFTARKD